MQEEKTKKYRDELEEITRELVQLEDEVEVLQVKIDKIDEVKENAKMKELCFKKGTIQTRIESMKKRRNHLINLLNTAKE